MVFLLTVLAAFRVWRLWAHDALPPLIWAREAVEGAVLRRFGPVWAGGVSCSACSGFWISAAVVGAVWHYRPLPLPALWFAAVSTLVILIAQRDND